MKAMAFALLAGLLVVNTGCGHVRTDIAQSYADRVAIDQGEALAVAQDSLRQIYILDIRLETNTDDQGKLEEVRSWMTADDRGFFHPRYYYSENLVYAHRTFSYARHRVEFAEVARIELRGVLGPWGGGSHITLFDKDGNALVVIPVSQFIKPELVNRLLSAMLMLCPNVK